MGYGVIGSPTDSGSVSLGSSPGTPAPSQDRTAPSSRGPGRRPLKAVAPVRIRSGLHPWHPSAHPSGVSRGDFALSCPARTPAASGGDPRPLDRPPFGRPWAGRPSGGGRAPSGGGRGRPSGGGRASFGRGPGQPSCGGRASFGRGPGQPSCGGGGQSSGRRPGLVPSWAGPAFGRRRGQSSGRRPGLVRSWGGPPFGRRRGPAFGAAARHPPSAAGPAFGEGGNGGRWGALTWGRHSGGGSVVRGRDSRIVVTGPEPPAGSGSG